MGGYVDDAKRAVASAVKLPSGYALEWSGQYENMQRVTERLKLVVPFTPFLILFLLYANTKSLAKTLIMWSIGTGSDVMKRVTAPMVGGLAVQRGRRGRRSAARSGGRAWPATGVSGSSPRAMRVEP